MKPSEFISNVDEHPFVGASSSRLVNMYKSSNPSYKYKHVFDNFPGWTVFSSPVASSCRGAVTFKDHLYVVVGHSIYKITEGGAATLLGAISTSEGPVSMAENGFEIMLADGDKMWRYDGAVLSTPTMPFSEGPSKVIFHEGYFVTLRPNTSQFYISGSFDGNTWNALQFATAEDKPDNIVELTSDRLLWLFGEYTTQAYDTYPDTFPFKPNYTGRVLYGIRGRTAAQLSNTTYFLGSAKTGRGVTVYRFNGFQPEPVSGPGYSKLWSSFSDIDDAYAMSFSWDGQEFYLLTFPVTNRSFVYSPAGGWSEWGEWNEDQNTWTKHPALWFTVIGDETVFGDAHGNIMKLDRSTTLHNGNTNVRQVISDTYHQNPQRVHIGLLEMDMEVGYHDADTTPTVFLAVSKDGGNTFGNDIPRTQGDAGWYDTRVRWVRLGSGYNMVFRLSVSDDFNWRLQGGIVQ